MTTSDLNMFMENLKQILYDDSNELISSNRLIKDKKPEIELVYKELDYLIRSGLNNMNTDEVKLHEAEVVGNWKRRVASVALDAENAIDMFISSAILKEFDNVQILKKPPRLVGTNFISSAFLKVNGIFTSTGNSDADDCSLKLESVMKDLKSIRKEMEHNTRKSQNESSVIHNNLQHLVQFQSGSPHVGEASSSKTTERMNSSVTEHEQIVVGFDEDALLIMERLAGDRKQLDIVSIVGMGGLGKTTLATKVFNDQYVEYFFDVRGWITVSEEYATRDLLIGILASIGKSVDEASATEGKLCEMVYKSLKGRKYLIVIDDIWSAKAWDDLRLYFPDDNTGSRILLTSRLTEVALHISPGGLTHHLQYLSQENSWKLLRRKIFRGNECPVNLIWPGKHIAAMCKGLPLALVVIAGLLEKGDKSEDVWYKVARNVGSFIVDNPNGFLDTVSLSYDHLPRQSFPNIKKLGCYVSYKFCNFTLLSHLESLNVEAFMGSPFLRMHPLVLPETLKKLTLKGLRMYWVCMSKIQQLPKLEVLKLLDSSFEGSMWDMGDGQFHQLKFLKFQGLNIQVWKVSTFNFPQLRKLEVGTCYKLKEIPLEIGNISTLEHIEIVDPTFALINSVNKIQEEQRAMGNYDIHFKIVGSALHRKSFSRQTPIMNSFLIWPKPLFLTKKKTDYQKLLAVFCKRMHHV